MCIADIILYGVLKFVGEILFCVGLVKTLSYIILGFERAREDVPRQRKAKRKIRKVFASSFSFLNSKTQGLRSGNRNSFKTTFYFRAINFFQKKKMKRILLQKKSKRTHKPSDFRAQMLILRSVFSSKPF